MKRSVFTLLIALAPMIAAAQTADAPSHAPPGMRMRDVISRLSPQGQALFHNEWLANEKMRAQARRDATRAAELNVFVAMDAEPFDAGALRHAYAMQRDVMAHNDRERQEHMVGIIKRLSAADRHMLVNLLRAMRGKSH